MFFFFFLFFFFLLIHLIPPLPFHLSSSATMFDSRRCSTQAINTRAKAKDNLREMSL